MIDIINHFIKGDESVYMNGIKIDTETFNCKKIDDESVLFSVIYLHDNGAKHFVFFLVESIKEFKSDNKFIHIIKPDNSVLKFEKY